MAKARTNLTKHGVSFRLATTVFRDPLAPSVYDEEHSEDEERWVTLARARNGQYLAVVHTWESVASDEIRIRIISARRPTARRSAITNRRRASGRRKVMR